MFSACVLAPRQPAVGKLALDAVATPRTTSLVHLVRLPTWGGSPPVTDFVT